jgi:hypothetical protein
MTKKEELNIEQVDPLVEALSFSEEIQSISETISPVLTGAVVVSVDLVVLFVLSALVYIYHVEFLGTSLAIFLVLSAVLIGYFVTMAIPSGYKSRKRLMSWNENFLRFSYILKFETFPAKGDTPQLKMFNQLLSVFPTLQNAFEDYRHKRSDGEGDFVGLTVKAKKSLIDQLLGREKTEHSFDVYIGEQALKTDSKLSDFVKSHGDVFVRRYESKTPVTAAELNKFRDEIADFTRDEQPFRIVAVSTSSFADSAKAYAEEESIDLIEEKAKGYYVEQIA